MNMQYSKCQSLAYPDSFSDYRNLTICCFLDRFRFAVDDCVTARQMHSENPGMPVVEDITAKFLEVIKISLIVAG